MKTPIEKTAGNWTTEHKADGTMIVHMEKNVSIYLQLGIASVYQGAELLTETEVGYMPLPHLNLYLHHIYASI